MTTESILAPIAALTVPDAGALTARAQSALDFINSFVVDSQEAYALAGEELRAIKRRADSIEEQRTAITGPINGGLKAINNLFRGPADVLAKAETALKGKMLTWSQEQQRIADDLRRKAEAAAAEARRKLEAEAAAAQAEAAAQARAVAEAQAAGNAQAAALAQAAADRANAEAQTAATSAQLTIAQPVAVLAPKAAGISQSTKLDFEVTSLHELVKHVAAHPELLSLVQADAVRLRAYVKGLGTSCALPGVRVFETTIMSARAA